MKLNYKRTILVGFAFFLISTFWQAYDATIAMTLTNKFGMSQFLSGWVMALDNILALFMLPLFGSISDKHMGKSGRRTPFIRLGTIIAAAALVALSLADNYQLKNLGVVADVDTPASLSTLYEAKSDTKLKTPDGKEFQLSYVFESEEHFSKVLSDNTAYLYQTGEKEYFAVVPYTIEQQKAYSVVPGTVSTLRLHKDAEPIQLLYVDQDTYDEQLVNQSFTLGERTVEATLFSEFSPYVDYVVPARQSYAADQTLSDPLPLVLFIALLLVILVSMAIFRSPAVALMPDVTVKPLRSKANAIINLMGNAGGILVLLLGIAFQTSAPKNSVMSYSIYYGVIAAVMVCALIVFLTSVKEVKWAAQMKADSVKYGIEEETDDDTSKKRSLTKGEKVSLILILASIALWYFGYNAVTSKYSVYATDVLQKDFNTTMLLAQAAAIVTFLPSGMIASKIGRKKTILAGVIMLCTAFTIAAFMRKASPSWLMNIMFMLAGVAWATINVNSFPMVVEMCSGADVGKYTGFYYTASMAAQTITPIFSGFLMDIRKTFLFPYAAIFVALAFVTMLFVRHGDSKATAKKGLEALDIDD